MTSTNGRVELVVDRLAERLEELLAAERRREHLVVEVDLGQAGDRAEQDVLDAGLPGRGDRDASPRRSSSPPRSTGCGPPRLPGAIGSAAIPHPSVRRSPSSPRAPARPPAAPRRAAAPGPAPATGAAQREASSSLSAPQRAAAARRPAPPRSPARRPSTRVPSRHELEGERQRVGHHLAQVPDLHLDPRDRPPGRVALGDARRSPRRSRARARQQILGSGSPTSWSITRLPPNAVSTSTIPGGSVLTSPISAASSPPGAARSAASAASAASGRDEGHELALVGDVHRVDAEQLGRAGDRRVHRHVGLAHDDRHAGGAGQLVEHRGDAAAGGVAQAAQRRRRRRRAARRPRGHSERVSDSIVGARARTRRGRA